MTARALMYVLLIWGLAGCDQRATERQPPADIAVLRGSDARPDGEVSRRSVSIDGVTLSILEGGSGDPIIFVHGVVTTSNIFPSYVRAYSPAYRGIAVDLRGYGDSEKPATGFTIARFSKDLIALADALHIQKPVWVGVSMGGMILQRLALDYPDRVRALVLVSTTDGAMVLDKDLPSIGNGRDYREVSKTIIAESFPPGTPPSLYQPLLDRITTWNGTVLREALTSMSQANVHGQLSKILSPPSLSSVPKMTSALPPSREAFRRRSQDLNWSNSIQGTL